DPATTTTSGPPSTPTTSSAPPTSASPTSQTAAVVREELLGLTQDQVAARLNELGMGFAPSVGRVAPSPAEVGLSSEVSPYGPNVQLGTVINVTFYDAIPTPPAPGAPTVQSGPDAPAPGDQVTITWPTYGQCPGGTQLTNYIFTVSNGGSMVGGNTVAPTATQATISVAGDFTGDITVSYIARCGELTSASSPAASFTVVPPPTNGGEGG